jgi:hypothetical protein
MSMKGVLMDYVAADNMTTLTTFKNLLKARNSSHLTVLFQFPIGSRAPG